MLIDTFPDFMKVWQKFVATDEDGKLEAWIDYMAAYPELLEKQKADYERSEQSWEEIARTRIFPELESRMPGMQKASRLICEMAPDVVTSARQILSLQSDPIIVAYVGIGCGAGWATEYGGDPAILLGLENIVECGWTDKSSLGGLVAHEVGHLFHFELRRKENLEVGGGSFWQLYTEGFAQRVEHLVAGKPTWHMATGINDEIWLPWCEENLSCLASEFLESSDSEEKTRRFFGHWYDLWGKRQCGYYLGHEVIARMEDTDPLRTIALYPEPEKRVSEVVQMMAENRT